MHISEVEKMRLEKEHLMRHEGKHPANMSFNEQRYRGVSHNLDREFEKSDKRYNEGKLSSEQYHAEQAASEKRHDEYLSDLNQREKDRYSDRMQQK